jgi:TolB-like protein
MKKKSFVLGSVVAGVLIFTGCGSDINISKFPKRVMSPYQIPDICHDEYAKLKSLPKVAVVKFTNNSSFGVANSSNTNIDSTVNTTRTGKHVGGAYVGVTGTGVGVVHGSAYKTNTKTKKDVNIDNTTRVVDPKLDKSITSAIETVLASMGGADVFTREDLDKVLKEQNLQQSGLVDDNTIVQVGKLAGVKYIITGSLDSVSQEFRDYSDVSKAVNNDNNSNSSNQQNSWMSLLAKVGVSAVASHQSGMKITARISVKVIDVETGKIVLSKKIDETKNIGMIKNPNYDQKIGGIKGAIEAGLNQILPEMSDFFSVSGYIVQVRSDKDRKNYIAQINLGKDNKVIPNQTFYAYTFEELTDPISGKTSCSKNRLDVTLSVSKNQINKENSWTVVDGDDAPMLRPGQIIKREALD